MSFAEVTDILGIISIAFGALLCLAAAVGLLRFPDLLTRMHAATKPQVLGILMTLLGVGLITNSVLHFGMLLLIAVFQMLTIPVGAHMIGRAGFRTGQVPQADIHLSQRPDNPVPERSSGSSEDAHGDADTERDTSTKSEPPV